MRIIVFIFAGFLLFSVLSGCAVLLVGAGAAGGLAISKDTAALERDASFDRAWSVTYATLNSMGAINLQDKKAGKIEANVRDSSIIAKVKQMTPHSVRVQIKARKNLLPNMDLAVEIINSISRAL